MYSRNWIFLNKYNHTKLQAITHLIINISLDRSSPLNKTQAQVINLND